MNTKLYVGNLAFDTTENDLRDMLGAFGTVSEVNLIMDRATGRSRIRQRKVKQTTRRQCRAHGRTGE